jgi:broad specificity phosphatase PhoE
MHSLPVLSATGSWSTDGPPASNTVLILVRHGESTGNAEGLLLGRIDSPLTARGLEQARSLADTVSGATRLISSPLARARHTAAALGTGLPIEIDDRWIEVDYGEFDGQKLGDIPAEVWLEWRSDPTFTPPGGESLAAAGARVREACEELFADHGGPARGDNSVVVVSHVSPIKAAACWSLGIGDEGVWRLYLANASATRITWGPGGAVLAGFNHTPWSSGL